MSKLREQPGVPTTFPTRRVRNPDAFTGDASRHYVGTSNGLHPEDRPYQTDERRRHGAMNRQPVVYNDEDDTLYETRSHSSARRYTMPAPQRPQAVIRYHYQQIPPRSSRTQTQDEQPEPQPQRAKARRQWHWSVYVGLTMLVGVVLFIVGSTVVSWWHIHQDDAIYGRPRTSQGDAVVGHNDSPQHPSHFIALNLNKPSERGLRSILTNPVYIGWWIPIEGGVIENNHEPIVDEWLFTYAHKRLSTHDLNGERQKPALVRNGNTEALLKKVTVGENGHRVYAKTDRKCGYYVACTYGTLSQEYEVSVSVKWLDEVFLEKFLERVVSIDPAKLSDWEDAIEQKQATREERKKLIRRQVNDAQRQRRETMDILDDPEVPKTKQMKIDYANKIAGLEAKIAEWEQQLEAPNDDEDDEEVIYEISTLIPRIGDVWPGLPFDKKLRFVGALVNRASLRSVAPNWLELRIEWKMEGWETDIAYIQALKGTGKKWTKEEEKLLGELYPSGEAEELLEAFPDRSWQGIYSHAHKLGVHRVSLGRGPGGTRLDDRMPLNDIKFIEEHGIASDKKVHWLNLWSG